MRATDTVHSMAPIWLKCEGCLNKRQDGSDLAVAYFRHLPVNDSD